MENIFKNYGFEVIDKDSISETTNSLRPSLNPFSGYIFLQQVPISESEYSIFEKLLGTVNNKSTSYYTLKPIDSENPEVKIGIVVDDIGNNISVFQSVECLGSIWSIPEFKNIILDMTKEVAKIRKEIRENNKLDTKIDINSIPADSVPIQGIDPPMGVIPMDDTWIVRSNISSPAGYIRYDSNSHQYYTNYGNGKSSSIKC